MPLPMETLLRVHASPVPTQTVSVLRLSISTAPIDCTGWLSNTGVNVVAPSSDFQTPPLAAPTHSISLPSGIVTASRDEMRPLIVAEPMLRAPRPEMIAESNAATAGFAGAAANAAGASARLDVRASREARRICMACLPYFLAVVGNEK